MSEFPLTGHVDNEREAAIAPLNLDTAIAFGHTVSICGHTTGHMHRTIIMCDSKERAVIVAKALRAYAERGETP